MRFASGSVFKNGEVATVPTKVLMFSHFVYNIFSTLISCIRNRFVNISRYIALFCVVLLIDMIHHRSTKLSIAIYIRPSGCVTKCQVFQCIIVFCICYLEVDPLHEMIINKTYVLFI